MPKPTEDIDIWQTLQYLLQRVSALEGRDDVAFRFLSSVPGPTVSTAQAVDTDTPASENPTMSVVLPTAATSTAVDTDTPGSENPTSSVPIPTVSTSTAVI
jgi:hypothetical protein